MDVVIIFNGLGNQMSQYAFYMHKKHISKSTEYIDFCNVHNGPELERLFDINLKQNILHKALYIIFRLLIANKPYIKPIQFLFKLIGFKVIYENFDYSFNADYLKPRKGINFYYGGWPSEKYFLPVAELVSNTYKFKQPADAENTAIINHITSANSVALHVRRGDYLSAENVNLFGGVCTKRYFENAVNLISKKSPNPTFFVFSNDFGWVKENLILGDAVYVTCNTDSDSWKDMYLMSLCKHNIISNSTFSWWAAWLNNYSKKIVISPSKYLNNDTKTDVYPDSWVKIKD